MREGTDEAFITTLLQGQTPALCPDDLGRGQGRLQGHPSCSHAQKGRTLDLRLCCYHLGILIVVHSLSCVQLSASPSMDCSMPGFPDLQHLLEFAQIHVH